MTITGTTVGGTGHHNGSVTEPPKPDPEVLERSAGRRQFSAKYKSRILAEYEALPRSARGALVRREGLYSSLISSWRDQRDKGAEVALGRPAGCRCQKTDPRDHEITRLKQKVGRLESELDKTTRVVEIQRDHAALSEALASTSTAENSEKP